MELACVSTLDARACAAIPGRVMPSFDQIDEIDRSIDRRFAQAKRRADHDHSIKSHQSHHFTTLIIITCRFINAKRAKVTRESAELRLFSLVDSVDPIKNLDTTRCQQTTQSS